MVNRKAFFEIFFYNRENPSRELVEMAESVWRAYMAKYGLGLDAGATGQPTYEEVKEITYLANYAVEMVTAKMTAGETGGKHEAPAEETEDVPEEVAEEATNEVFEESPDGISEEITEVVFEEVPEEITEEAAEEIPEERFQETAVDVSEENIKEATEAVTEEAFETVTEAVIVEAAEEVISEVTEAKTVPQIPEEDVFIKSAAPEKPVCKTGTDCGASLWAEETIRWCQSKNLLCIKTIDDGDIYLHVYLPHKKKVHPVGTWCLQKNTNGVDLAAEITKLYAYCTGFADCFEQLMKK